MLTIEDLKRYRYARLYDNPDNHFWGYLTVNHFIEISTTEAIPKTDEYVQLLDIIGPSGRSRLIKSITVKYGDTIVMHEYLED